MYSTDNFAGSKIGSQSASDGSLQAEAQEMPIQ